MLMAGVTAYQPPAAAVVSPVPPGITMVRFNNNNFGAPGAALTRASQATATTPFFTLSMWFRVSQIADELVLLMPQAFYSCYIQINGLNTADVLAQFNDNVSGKFIQAGSTANVITAGVVHHLFMSFDTNHATLPSKLHNVWLNGVNVEDAGSYAGDTSAFSFTFGGQPFGMPSDSGDLGIASDNIIDYADVWIAYGQYVNPATSISAFRNPGTGFPVALGATGQLPTGTSPTYFFTGNASTFATNQGTGGAVTLYGSISDAP